MMDNEFETEKPFVVTTADMLEIVAGGGNGVEYVDITGLMETAAKELREKDDEIERLRGMLISALDGLDEYWVTFPEGVELVNQIKALIPASALDVNKELLEAAKAATTYCEEIAMLGSKYGTLQGPIVSDARSIARGLNEAIAAAD